MLSWQTTVLWLPYKGILTLSNAMLFDMPWAGMNIPPLSLLKITISVFFASNWGPENTTNYMLGAIYYRPQSRKIIILVVSVCALLLEPIDLDFWYEGQQQKVP